MMEGYSRPSEPRTFSIAARIASAFSGFEKSVKGSFLNSSSTLCVCIDYRYRCRSNSLNSHASSSSGLNGLFFVLPCNNITGLLAPVRRFGVSKNKLPTGEKIRVQLARCSDFTSKSCVFNTHGLERRHASPHIMWKTDFEVRI